MAHLARTHPSYDVLKEHLAQRWSHVPTVVALAPLVAGGVARTCVAFAFSPLELVRTRMQAVKSTSSILDMLREEIR